MRTTYTAHSVKTGKPFPKTTSNTEVWAMVNWLILVDKTHVPYGISDDEIRNIFEVRAKGKAKIESATHN